MRIEAFLVAALFLTASPVFAASENNRESVNPLLVKACAVIKENIKKGLNIRKHVKVSIQIGHNPCFVVKCGVEGGGKLDEIITGAVEGGATPDVVSRCAIDAGANVFEVARLIMQADSPSIAFFEPQEEFIPIETGVPGDIGGTGISISPSSFGR